MSSSQCRLIIEPVLNGFIISQAQVFLSSTSGSIEPCTLQCKLDFKDQAFEPETRLDPSLNFRLFCVCPLKPIPSQLDGFFIIVWSSFKTAKNVFRGQRRKKNESFFCTKTMLGLFMPLIQASITNWILLVSMLTLNSFWYGWFYLLKSWQEPNLRPFSHPPTMQPSLRPRWNL